MYGKNYENDEEEMRRNIIWQSNKQYIEAHNENADKFGFELGMNALGDLESHEVVDLFNGYNQEMKNSSRRVFTYNPNIEAEATVDWREKGAVTGVKNQGQCGSCWSFSATGSLEGQHFLKTGTLVSLSEQNLIDCSTRYGNHGCKGGLMDNAFRYIEANHGIDTERSYPYQAHDELCRFREANVGATLNGYVDIPRRDEKALTQAIQAIGPISVAIDASKKTFHYYKSGVYYDFLCSSTKLDHGVLAVGYGTMDGKDYYIVKNSWGPQWGMEGYVMMSRNRENNCGIATQASYPKVE
jgi:cathepsin L